ncbi:SDR family oxidoreductase [Tissierella creatinini]|nr:SDR family oxidoreductase [Tissierella creatinini]TJX59709.1 SDR family oxidoreductase [Soehngenia saccharolytica]
MASIKAFDQQFAYGSTKAAVSHFMKIIAVSYANEGIRANAISQGLFLYITYNLLLF